VEIQNQDSVTVEEHLSKACRMMGNINKAQIPTLKHTHSLHRILYIRNNDYLFKTFDCSQYVVSMPSFGDVDSRNTSIEDIFQSQNFGKLAMPDSDVVNFVTSFNTTLAIPLNSQILSSTLAFSRHFIKYVTGGLFSKRTFQLCLAITKSMLNQNLSKTSSSIQVGNRFIRAFSFDNIHDELPHLLVITEVSTAEPTENKIHDNHELFKIYKVMFRKTISKQINFLTYQIDFEGTLHVSE